MNNITKKSFLMLWMWLGLLFIFSVACSNSNNGAEVGVSTTEEYMALGYPDGRKIVRDSKNNLYVAYRKKYRMNGAEQYHIFVAKSGNQGQSWQVTHNNTPIERVGDYVQRVPAIAVDGNDILHVVWYGNDAQNTGENERQIKYSRSSDSGQTWSNWARIADVDGYRNQDLWQEHPTIYANGKNGLYVVWQGKDAEHEQSQVKFSMSTDGGDSWTSWINVNPSNKTNYSRPTIVTSRDGRTLYILAYSGTNKIQQIVWTQSTDGGKNWSAWQPVAPDDYDQRHVSIAVDKQDRLHAVWRQEPDAGDPSQIRYAFYNGQAWSKPEWVGPNAAVYQVFPSITVTADNQVWVVWSENKTAPDYPQENPGSGSVYYAVNTKQQWGPRSPLREGGSKDIYPSLGRNQPEYIGRKDSYLRLDWYPFGNDDQVDLVWLENVDSADNTIYYESLN